MHSRSDRIPCQYVSRKNKWPRGNGEKDPQGTAARCSFLAPAEQLAITAINNVDDAIEHVHGVRWRDSGRWCT
jgi:hypothetical protein